MLCKNCGTQLTDNARFCDACGTQTAEEQAAIQAQRERNVEAHLDKTMSGSVWLTVGMAAFSLFFVLFMGFEEGEARVATITAIAFSVFICGIKWFFEIKNQRQWKKEAQEKERVSNRGTEDTEN